MKRLFQLCLIIVCGYFAYQYFGLSSFSDSNDEVMLFTFDECPPCIEMAEFLDEHDIVYTEYDINASEENMKKYRRNKVGRAIPLLIMNGERFEGFDRSLMSIAVNAMPDSDGGTDVVMYSTQRCGWCKKASQFFSKHNIEVSEYDIEASSGNMQEYKRLGGRGVPLIFVGENRIEGYNEKAMKLALKQCGLM